MKKLYRCLSFTAALMLLFTSVTLAQERVVTGTITDENRNPMPGVNVILKGTTQGTASDVDGKYSISVPSDQATLVISFVGYATSEVLVGSRTSIDMQMNLDVTTLSELVVTGYSTQEKRDITGSIAVVDTKDMKKIAASNFAEQLQGKVAGVQISTSGDPGSSQFIRIRGIGTINNNEPLYVIDGIPVQNEANMNFLNPNDIESMQVLKDAASASIYGSRASNGVIVITTKKGKAGNSKVNIDYFYGVSDPAKFPEMATPDELLQINQGLAAGAGQTFSSNFYINEGGGTYSLPDYMVRGSITGGFNEGAAEVNPNLYFLNPDPNGNSGINYLISKSNKAGTDWFKETFNSAPSQSFQISTSGGSDKGNYFLSANYYNQNGILIENFYKRYQMRMNSTFSVKERIRIGETLNIAYQTTQGSVGNPNEGSPIKNAYAMPRIVPVYDINGYFAGPAALPSNASNPVAQQKRSAAGSFGHSFRFTGNLFAEIDILKSLTYKTSFGIDYNQGPYSYYGFRNYDATEVNASNSLSQGMFNNRNWVFFNTLRFNKTFGDHKVDALGGIESKYNYYQGISAGGSRLEFGDDPNYRILNNTAGGTYNVNSYFGDVSKFSTFVSGNYSFMDKYLVSATIRRDGSSRFLNNKYGVFPAASVGWRISEEAFMAGVNGVDDLKLRVSYGSTGNDEVLGGDYPGYSNFNTSVGTSSYDINGTGNSVVAGFDQTSNANPDLKWETTTVLNIGVDANLFGAIDATIEWFDRTTTDMIYPVEPPLEIGSIGRRNTNIGDMQNTGLEASIKYNGKAMAGDFTYSVGLTGTAIKNKVLRLDANSNTFIRSGGSRIGDINFTQAGEPIAQFYGYVADGLWESQEEIDAVLFENAGDAKIGRAKFKDLNADGQINVDDETFIGNPNPKFILGVNLTAGYKGFDFTAFLTGSYGHDLFNFVKYFTHFPAFQGNYSKDMLYEAGKSLPVLDRGDNYSPQRSTLYVEDGSFTRLRNLQLGYTIPVGAASKVGFEKVRVYIQGQNLLTFTKYSGLDPDVTIGNITEGYQPQRDLNLGVDYGRYPWSRTYLVGVNLEF